MTDTCGPSNALKSLQNQFDTDRSLHQSQGQSHLQQQQHQPFREGPTQQQLQRAKQDYDQFINASRQDQPLERLRLDPPQAFTAHQQLPNSQWTKQFQDHHQQQQQPLPQSLHQENNHRSLARTGQLGSTNGWGSEFLAHHPTMMLMPPPHLPSSTLLYQPTFHPLIPSTTTTTTIGNQSSVLDEAAMSEAFQRAERALQRTTLDDAPDLSFLPHPVEESSSSFPLSSSSSFLGVPESEVEQRTKARVDEQIERDGMSGIASDLIESLKTEEDPKFKNSGFMQLMRRLRDGEVSVREDNMVRTDGTIITSHMEGQLDGQT